MGSESKFLDELRNYQWWTTKWFLINTEATSFLVGDTGSLKTKKSWKKTVWATKTNKFL